MEKIDGKYPLGGVWKHPTSRGLYILGKSEDVRGWIDGSNGREGCMDEFVFVRYEKQDLFDRGLEGVVFSSSLFHALRDGELPDPMTPEEIDLELMLNPQPDPRELFNYE